MKIYYVYQHTEMLLTRRLLTFAFASGGLFFGSLVGRCGFVFITGISAVCLLVVLQQVPDSNKARQNYTHTQHTLMDISGSQSAVTRITLDVE